MNLKLNISKPVFRGFGLSDRGAVRKENQDCFRLAVPEKGGVLTAVLCDGMGGAQAGSVASSIAADAFMFHAANSIDESSGIADLRAIMTDAINYANIKVYDRSFSDFECMGMGSTLVAILMSSKHTLIANVGDSRAYVISKGSITQITRDHSLVGEMVLKGQLTPQEAENHPKKNIITRAIGVEASVKSDLYEVKLVPGSRILLCSDGLSNMLTDSEMLDILTRENEPERCCETLVELAVGRGAPDNVTALVADR